MGTEAIAHVGAEGSPILIANILFKQRAQQFAAGRHPDFPVVAVFIVRSRFSIDQRLKVADLRGPADVAAYLIGVVVVEALNELYLGARPRGHRQKDDVDDLASAPDVQLAGGVPDDFDALDFGGSNAIQLIPR